MRALLCVTVAVLITVVVGQTWEENGSANDDELPFDNAHSIERILDLFSSDNAIIETPVTNDRTDARDTLLEKTKLNGFTKFRDDISANMNNRTLIDVADELALKLIDESMELNINGTDSEHELADFVLLNATGLPSIESFDLNGENRISLVPAIALLSFVLLLL